MTDTQRRKQRPGPGCRFHVLLTNIGALKSNNGLLQIDCGTGRTAFRSGYTAPVPRTKTAPFGTTAHARLLTRKTNVREKNFSAGASAREIPPAGLDWKRTPSAHLFPSLVEVYTAASPFLKRFSALSPSFCIMVASVAFVRLLLPSPSLPAATDVIVGIQCTPPKITASAQVHVVRRGRALSTTCRTFLPNLKRRSGRTKAQEGVADCCAASAQGGRVVET